MATAFQADVVAPADPFDVSSAAMWSEDRWQAPFAELRAKNPVHYTPESKFGPYWSVSTYAPIQKAESMPDIFSSSWELGGITVGGDGVEFLREFEIPMPMFIAMDGEQHQAQRKTVAPAFGPSEVSRLWADAVQRTADVIESLPVGQPFDWVDKVSIELTTQMLAILFDFPQEERRMLSYWSDVLGDVESVEGGDDARKKRLEVAFEMGAAFKTLWEEKAKSPGAHDLISTMMRSSAMSHMSEGEFMGNLILLIVGGNDTTRNSMSAYAYGLQQFPDQRAILETNHSHDLAVNAMHEILRWQTPLAHMRRTATQDVEFEGKQIKKRDKVVLWYASGNRDETVFPNGDKILVERENARRHLAFGYGIHRCVGARVAELQLTSLIAEMQKRRLRVNVLGAPDRVHGCFVHGYKKMMVELERY